MKRPEQQLQIQVANYLRVALRPPTFWTAIDHGVGKLGRAEAGLRRARGVKAGLPDLMIIYPWQNCTPRIVGIELKAANGTQSLAQKGVEFAWTQARAGYAVCRSVEEVDRVLRMWCIPLHAKLS